MTTYSYNDCGFVTGIAYTGQSSQNVSIGYDAYNRRTSMSDATGSATYTYDDLNNLATVTTDFTSGPQDKEVSYSYWPNGNRKTMETPAGTFNYAYDAVGRLNEMENPFSETTTWGYYSNGFLLAQNLANGASAYYGYNARGLLSGLDNEIGGGDIFGIFTGPNSGSAMTYDAAGSRTGMGVSGSLADSMVHPGDTGYTYSTKNELTQETSSRVGGTLNQGFAYDSAGNPTTLRGTSSIPYNRNNQRTGSETYEYDGNGNPVKYKSSTQNMWFDVENRLTQFGTAMYAGYNGDGLRAWKTANTVTTYFLYDGTDLLCEMNSSGTVLATNTWGASGLVSRRVGSTSTFYVFDPQGSVAQRLDASGNVLSNDLYDAYGICISGSTTDPVGYCGQWGYYTDAETSLILCTWRYYDPANGRWITRDPIGYGGGVNLYGYVGGDPVNLSDNLGLAWTPPMSSSRSINTIVCDGCGGVKVQIGAPGGKCLDGCILQHELSHLQDLLKANPDICKGKPAGTAIWFSDLRQTERKAYDIEVSCLQKLIGHTSPSCTSLIRERLDRIARYRRQRGY